MLSTEYGLVSITWIFVSWCQKLFHNWFLQPFILGSCFPPNRCICALKFIMWRFSYLYVLFLCMYNKCKLSDCNESAVLCQMVHMIFSAIFQVNLQEQGRLLRQEEFLVFQGRKKSMRRIFLFEDLILFSKTRRGRQGQHDIYVYKTSFKVCSIFAPFF